MLYLYNFNICHNKYPNKCQKMIIFNIFQLKIKNMFQNLILQACILFCFHYKIIFMKIISKYFYYLLLNWKHKSPNFIKR